MKNYYIFLLSVLFIGQTQAQTNCSEANSDINYAYSHIKSAYDANNISDLQYYAYRSFEALKRAEPILKACGCEPTLRLTEDGISLLERVDNADSYEDGRFYVKRARELSRKGIASLDECNQISAEEEELLTLEMEQQTLKMKQQELLRQQQELEQRLLDQKKKELLIQKELLITNYGAALSSNVKSYNESLRNFDCSSPVEIDTPSHDELLEKTPKALKSYYMNAIKKAADRYLMSMEKCASSSGLTTLDD